MRESAVRNSPLPPSVEKAYHQKCIELKRRIRGVEDNNDIARQRVHRLDRAIMKMRVNRAFLMDRLAKLQELNDAESDMSSTRPSSPPEHLSRPKSRRDATPPPAHRASPAAGAPSESHSFAQAAPPPSSLHTQSPGQPAHRPVAAQAAEPNYSHQSPYTPSHQEPLIHTLPNGTSVMLIAPGTPKPAPWHISELDPRHHVSREFETWTLDEQEDYIFGRDYLPFDKAGNPVRVEYDPVIKKYVHIFPSQPGYRNPVEMNVRTDTAENRQRLPRPPPGPEEMRGREGSERSPPQPHAGGFTSANR